MRRTAALALACLPLLAHAIWGDPAAVRQLRRAHPHQPQHFGAQLVLTPDEGQFVRAWTSVRMLADLPATGSVRRGSSVAAVLVFQGCTPDGSGKCDVVADFSLLSPAGTLIPGGSAPLWSEAPAPGRLHLGNASMEVSFDPGDAPGRYRVIATVSDRVAGHTLTLSSALNVLE